MRNERAWPQQCWKSCANGSNIVALRFGDHGTKEMFGVVGWKVWPVSNFTYIQRHATGCANGCSMHVTSNNVGSCWSTMLRLFASSLIIKEWTNEHMNEWKRKWTKERTENERRNKLRYNEWINVITIFGAVKRGSLIRCAISSPLSSADLQNKVTDNLLTRQQKRFFMTVYCNTASF